VVTETMMLLAIRQKNWPQAVTIAKELSHRSRDDLFSAALSSALTRCQNDDPRARTLLSLWAELRWREKQ